MTVEEYRLAVQKLVKLMKLPKVSTEAQQELEGLLDTIDAYNELDFLKVK